MRKQQRTEHTRKLPHFHRVGATFFITTRLKNSLPFDVLKKLQNKRDEAIHLLRRKNPADLEKQIYLIRRAYFYEFDTLLDACKSGPTHLKNPKVARIVEEELHRYDKQYYNLITYTLMPNHLHLVLDFSIQVKEKQPFDIDLYTNVDVVMNKIKGTSSFYANQVIGNTGTPFWAVGYYDRYIRNYKHYLGSVNYTINNVVHAKIVQHWREHDHTWLHPDYQKFKLLFPR